jgi:hypothetical protein
MKTMPAYPLTASLGAAALASTLFCAGGAWADVIDGEWCATTDGRHFSIKGPEIVTPSGTRLEGRYTRHTFLYVVPPAEPGAGQIVSMILVNEETVNLRVAASAAEAALAPVQVWHRCPPGISRRDGAPPADRFG